MPIPFLNSISLNKNEVQDFKVFNVALDPTLTSNDVAYLWYNTASARMRYWTGTATRDLLDSSSSISGSQISGAITGRSGSVTGGDAGTILYQSAPNFTTFLTLGSPGQVLTVNPGATAPQWSDQSTLSVGSATTAGSVTNALTAGSYLTSGGSYNGAAARTFAVDATTTNTASKIVARDSNGDFAARNITANRISGLASVVSGDSNDVAANKGYVDSVAQGLSVKAFVTVASTGNINLSSPGTGLIDGVDPATFTSGTTRILVKNQTAPAENGIYIWNGSGSAMTRSTDADTWAELVGAYTYVSSGSSNAYSGWVTTIVAGGTLGTTAVTWTQFSQAGTYTANRGLTLSGSAFNFAQNSDYSTNSIPYASGTTTIGFISAGSADQVLRVPGVGGTPAFGSIDISKPAAVTGTLAVSNGGTGVTTSTGTGSVVLSASPTFTGIPISTTAAADTNTTQIATTAYVVGQASGSTPSPLGIASAGSSLKYARADHVHQFPTVDLISNVTGILPVTNGGTGSGTFVTGRLLFGNGTSAINTSGNLFWDNSNARLGVGTSVPSFTVDILSSSPQVKLTGSGTSSDLRINAAFGASDLGAIGTNGASPFMLFTNNTERLRVKSTGQVNFSGLAADPAGAAGDVYYSTGNYFKYHNGTAWQSFPRKYSAALSGAAGTDFTVTHNLNSQDVVVQVRKTASPYDLVYTDIKMTSSNTVTISFASSVTPADYTVTVIG